MEEIIDHFTEDTEELFDYNRENYFFDREQNIERQYQEQDMRVRQFELYREDIEDLVELTTGKMDAYMPPIVFELGICFLCLVHGELDGPGETRDPPAWLLWLYIVNLAEAFLYLFLAGWFAIHASVSAHSFGVRLLTQFVRLPIPNKTQLDAARRYASEFEGMTFNKAGEGMLRIPVIRQQLATRQPNAPGTSSSQAMPSSGATSFNANGATSFISSGATSFNANGATSSNAPAPESPMTAMQPAILPMKLKHIRLYRELQANWQAHDAYCRACIALGTYTLVHALSFFLIGYFVVELDAPGPALCCAIMLSAVAWLLVKLDLFFRTWAFVVAALLIMSGPVLAVVAITIRRSTWPNYIKFFEFVFVPIIFLLQACLIICIMEVARAEQVSASSGNANNTVALPTRFRTVLYLDVFGWMFEQSESQENGRSPTPPSPSSPSSPSGRRLQQEGGEMPEFPARPSVLPESVRKELLEECLNKYFSARQEVEAWENGMRNQRILQDIQEMRGLDQQVRAVQADFDSVQRECLSISSASSDGLRTSSVDGTPSVWLKFSWHSAQWCANPANGEHHRECDVPCNTVLSDIGKLHDTIRGLSAQVRALKASAPRASSTSELQTPASPVTPSRSGTRPGAAAPKTQSRAPRAFSSMPVPAISREISLGSVPTRAASSRSFAVVPQIDNASDPALLSTDVNAGAAQEGHFGGREAVNLSDFGLAELFGVGCRAAQTFFPRDDGRSESKTPPGQMPWLAFSYSSRILVILWLVGVIWYAIQPFVNHKFRAFNRPTEAFERAMEDAAPPLSNARLVFRGDRWPLRPAPLHPVGFACNHALGGQALLADEYGVFGIPLLEDTAAGLVPNADRDSRIESCLAQVPEFRNAGLNGISLECPTVGDCTALLLGLSGTHVMRCPLSKGGTRNAPELVALAPAHGHHAWATIVPGSSLYGGLMTWWGIPMNATLPPQKLHVQHGNRNGIHAFPLAKVKTHRNFEMQETEMSSVRGAMTNRIRYDAEMIVPTRQLHMHGSATLLGLSAAGSLVQAWRTDNETSKQSSYLGGWRLPTARRWGALCSIGNHLFLAGQPSAGSYGPEIWRFDLPTPLIEKPEMKSYVY